MHTSVDKQLRGVKMVQKDDEWVNEFMSFGRPMQSGGEYVMPVATARDILADIYGDEPSLEAVDYSGLEEDSAPEGSYESDARTPSRREDWDRMENLRRKADPVRRAQRRERMNLGFLPGIGKYIGSMPRELESRGKLGVRGGAADDSMQSVWVSGNSVSYDFEEGDW